MSIFWVVLLQIPEGDPIGNFLISKGIYRNISKLMAEGIHKEIAKRISKECVGGNGKISWECGRKVATQYF